jgi:hypothetical protein
MIAEAQHPIAFAFKKTIAPRVAPLMRILEMLPAIDFDDHVRIMTNKVDDERTDRRLPPEACAVEPVRTHPVPNDPFRIRHVSTQRARANAQLGRHLPRRIF